MTDEWIEEQLAVCEAAKRGPEKTREVAEFIVAARKGYPRVLRELTRARAEADDWKTKYVQSQQQWARKSG